MSDTVVGIKFSGSTETDVEKQNDNVQSPVKKEESVVEESGQLIGRKDIKDVAEASHSNEDLDKPYVDNRSVTIALVKNYSLYRRVNDKVMPDKVNYIGSSYKSSSILSSNKTEVEAYFPSFLGISPNNESFVTRVKMYLNNFHVPVDEFGKKLNTSFYYNHKRDYYKVKEQEENIENIYQMCNRNNIKKLEEALNEKITQLNNLESTKCSFGHPVNFEDYILYRHCLLYSDVAKDIAFINSGVGIRFYFKDDKKESDKVKKFQLEKLKAKNNYIAAYNDEKLFDAIYIQYCVMNNYPVITSLAKDRLTREVELDKFSSDDPIRFNKICTNKDCKLIGNIEKLIAYNELIRVTHSQNIITPDGQFVGANIIEALSWFKNPDNSQQVTHLINKLNNL